MTYEQLNDLLGRLSSAICQASKSMEMVHVIMSEMRKEKRAELTKAEWELLRPVLEITKGVVGKRFAIEAIANREMVKSDMGIGAQKVSTAALDKAVEDHFARAIKDAGGYVSDTTADIMKENLL